MNILPFASFRPARPVVVRHPWAAFDAELDRLFAPILAAPSVGRTQPVTSFEESDTAVAVRVELPGVKKDALTLEWHEDALILSIKKEEKQGNETVSRESRFSLSLPEAVQVDQATARLEDGVLTVTLPKVAPVQPRRIEIQ